MSTRQFIPLKGMMTAKGCTIVSYLVGGGGQDFAEGFLDLRIPDDSIRELHHCIYHLRRGRGGGDEGR